MKLRSFFHSWSCLCASAFICGSVAAAPLLAAGTAPRLLHVSMYPFIPDPDAAALALTQAFERLHPDIRVQITFNAQYYSTAPADRGVLFEDADVHEIDAVFLDDFLTAHRLQPLPRSIAADIGRLVPVAADIGLRGHATMAVPHWLCSDFLIYRNGLPGLDTARTLGDVEKALLPTHGLLIDMAGDGALGELYFASLLAERGAAGAAGSLGQPPGARFLDRARRMLAMEPPGFGRSAEYDARGSFYARQFARRAGSAFVGYSEMLHDMLAETQGSCRAEDRCLTQADIKVTAWPFADHGSRPPVWVDMFGIDQHVHGKALTDAATFIQFATSLEAYRALLIPQGQAPPRYLLPARDDVYQDRAVLAAAPLYPVFRRIIDTGVAATAPDLIGKLHRAAMAIDHALPPTH